jgi:predicted ATPase
MPTKAKGFSENSKNPAARRDWQIHAKIGTEFSAMAFDNALPLGERDRSKFLAADQLVISQEIMWEDRNSIVKLLLETAELCVMRSAFASAIVYLETGIDMLESKEQFTKDNIATCSKIYLWLAKLRLAYGRTDDAMIACDTLLKHAKTLKDKVPAVQVQLQILLVDGKKEEALDRALAMLEQLGENFPKISVPEYVASELEKLRGAVRQTDNAALLHPPRMTDKKAMDVMVLLADVLEISRLSRKRYVVNALAFWRVHG